MKKQYVSFLLNMITFEETDVIRTSGLTTQTSEDDVNVGWGSIFGGDE